MIAWMRMARFLKSALARYFLGALALSTAVIASNRDKYLAAVGPTPLRFQQVVPRLDPAKALPPLQMSDAALVVRASDNATNAAPETFSPQVQIEPQVYVSGSEASNDSSAEALFQPLHPATHAGPTQPQNAANLISPQVLLRYFSRNGTNEVLVPYSVDFTPPVPTTGGSSSAIYISE